MKSPFLVRIANFKHKFVCFSLLSFFKIKNNLTPGELLKSFTKRVTETSGRMYKSREM